MRFYRTATISMLCVASQMPQACLKAPLDQKSGSDLTSVTLTLPSNKAKDGTVLFDFYALEVTTTDSNCKDFEVANADSAASTEMTLADLVLKNACNYSVVLKLGMAAQKIAKAAAKGNKFTLDKPTYSNVVNGSTGKEVKSDDLKKVAANEKLKLDITVYKVDGSSQGPDQIKTPDTTDLSIDVSIGNGAQTDTSKKLPSNIQYAAKNNAELNNLLQGYPGLRMVVQFCRPDAPNCATQTTFTQAFLKTQAADAKTIFVLYDIFNGTTWVDNKDVWGLEVTKQGQTNVIEFPQTFVFEKGVAIKPALIKATPFVEADMQAKIREIFARPFTP